MDSQCVKLLYRVGYMKGGVQLLWSICEIKLCLQKALRGTIKVTTQGTLSLFTI